MMSIKSFGGIVTAVFLRFDFLCAPCGRSVKVPARHGLDAV
ncbi:hypothetical protein M774_09800 [Neisseria gonorrhoeae MU_NG5]|nr:hypothetical protein T556_10860 [Neisseria gonorrhoeae NG-k51.05]KLS10783.1 hypothetical protein M716_10840 [Neisseria gonorrhoeae SK32402]KLS60777.1 hypothetical protein M743_08820 [Neisseria gonorrhoeae NYC_2011_05_13]KLS87583.1 hypothetical protein M774_09800 [Neisseria gonorrhoeae MU_NG5]KLS90114.1 hypothetical protein M780_04015 [Neisseria gonorrhoeae MU_NG14]